MCSRKRGRPLSRGRFLPGIATLRACLVMAHASQQVGTVPGRKLARCPAKLEGILASYVSYSPRGGERTLDMQRNSTGKGQVVTVPHLRCQGVHSRPPRIQTLVPDCIRARSLACKTESSPPFSGAPHRYSGKCFDVSWSHLSRTMREKCNRRAEETRGAGDRFQPSAVRPPIRPQPQAWTSRSEATR
jgi:hypothetical protein